MRWFKDSDRYVREDGKCYIRQREVRINGRWCWRWCVYASKSNAIYGRSATVQPAAYYVHIWRRVA